ncbi:MAG TPA: glycosyltransferase [Allosphingosinicella sp.]|jgi:glycosyltransferase involved in cell wall biosynthesis
MLRVLVVTSRFPDRNRPHLGNFVERQAIELAGRPGVEVAVAVPVRVSPLGFGVRRPVRAILALPREEVWKGMTVFRPRYTAIPRLGGYNARSLARHLASALGEIRRSFPFDVIAAQFFWPEGPAALAAGRALGVPVSIKARGADFDQWQARRGLAPADLAEADGLLAVSAELRRRMIDRGLPADHIAVHHTGVDHSLFAPRDRAGAKAALGLSGPVLLSAGNLRPHKNPALAVDVLSRLEGATLLIAGGGPEAARLRRRIRHLGLEERVRMLGAVPHLQMPALYAAADVTLHTARLEGLANVWVESLACGTPVVTTAVGAAAEIIDRPEAGRLAAPDSEAMAAAVREILERPPRQTEVAAASAGFDWVRHAAEAEDHLRALADRHAAIAPRIIS